MKKKALWARIFIRLANVTLFVFFSGVLIASANGYLYDRQTGKFEQTGIINLNVLPDPVTVSVEGKAKLYDKPDINVSYLLPGQYTVNVAKPGYVTWEKSFVIASGQVILNPFVTLFLADNPKQIATEEEQTLLDSLPVSVVVDVDPDLDVRGAELWVKPISRTYPFTTAADSLSLLARFSAPIQSAKWYEGRNRIKTHIIFQTGNEIRIMDREGSNDAVLVTLQSSDPVAYITTDDKKSLIYKDGDQIYKRPLLGE